MKRRIFNILLLGFSMFALLVSCEYEFIPVPQPPPPNPTDTVFFTRDILPIFTTNNNCTGCHEAGNQSPDLTAANAYSSIISMGLADTAAPELSILYNYPKQGTSTHSWKKYTDSQANDVLQWIRQGALNN
ncbi:MAG: hypothetical protein NT175_12235 [Bacteroidetes bacterium]|nr:hypothetical protein [Bacteroidota bacterium]